MTREINHEVAGHRSLHRRGSQVAGALLLIYIGVLLELTLLQFPQVSPGANFIPFRTIRHDLAKGGHELVVNTFGNIAALMPFGFLLPIVFSREARSAGRVALASCGISGIIEVAQACSGCRVADVDDVFLNTLGGLVGYGAWLGWRRVGARRRSGSGIPVVSLEGASKTRPPTRP